MTAQTTPGPRFRDNGGNATELRRAHKVAVAVAAYLGLSEDEQRDIFLADHTHEEVGKGAATIALEGAYEWPYNFMQTEQARALERKMGVHFEAMTGWALIVYPGRD